MNYFTLALIFIIGLLVARMIVLEGISIFRLIKFRLKGFKVEYHFWPYSFLKGLILKEDKKDDVLHGLKKGIFESDENQPFGVLSKPAKEFKKLQNGFRKIISDQYKERYNSTTEEDLVDNSILDIMVKLNKKSERETGQPQFTLEEISDHFEMFHFACSDTSFQASCSLMTLLAQPENQKYQENVYSELEAETDFNEKKLSSLNELDLCFKETMRMANPAPQLSLGKSSKISNSAAIR